MECCRSQTGKSMLGGHEKWFFTYSSAMKNLPLEIYEGGSMRLNWDNFHNRKL
jgi:hypothetical protein